MLWSYRGVRPAANPVTSANARRDTGQAAGRRCSTRLLPAATPRPAACRPWLGGTAQAWATTPVSCLRRQRDRCSTCPSSASREWCYGVGVVVVGFRGPSAGRAGHLILVACEGPTVAGATAPVGCCYSAGTSYQGRTAS